MDALIRALPVSGEPVPLTIKRRIPHASRVPSAEAVCEPAAHIALVTEVPDPGRYARPAITPVDDGWRDEERSRIRAELAAEVAERADIVLEEARRRGHEEGLAAGKAEGARGHAEKAARIDAVLRAVHERLGDDLAGAEDLLVGLAFAAVCRILGEALVTPDGVRAVIGQALTRARDETRIAVRLAPADHALLMQAQSEFSGGGQREVQLVADDRVAMGGCLIETASGSLDARLETQLGQLRDVLLAIRQPSAE